MAIYGGLLRSFLALVLPKLEMDHEFYLLLCLSDLILHITEGFDFILTVLEIQYALHQT
jgi:hypothetical protein